MTTNHIERLDAALVRPCVGARPPRVRVYVV